MERADIMRIKKAGAFTAMLLIPLLHGCAANATPTAKNVEPLIADNMRPPVWAVQPAFGNAQSFSSGIACVNLSSETFFINPNGEKILDVFFNTIEAMTISSIPTQNGLAVAYDDKTKRI